MVQGDVYMDHQIVYALIDEWLKEFRQRAYQDLVLLMGHPQNERGHG